MSRVANFATRDDSDEFTLLINGQQWRHWTEVTLNTHIDEYSQIAFSAPFAYDDEVFRDTFRPREYQLLHLDIGATRVFTGTLIDIVPEISKEQAIIRCSGYSLPGVWADCTMPGERVPHEWRNVDLRHIANEIAAAFDLTVRFLAEPGAKFKQAKLDAGGQIQPFLVDLAQQRGLVISNSRDGAVVFQKSVSPGNPIAKLKEDRPVVQVVQTSQPQQYYSEITAFPSAKHGRGGSKFRIKNPYLATAIRPFAFEIEDTDPADAPAAAKAKLGRMFGNTVSYAIQGLPTIRDPQSDLWEENKTIKLTAPGAMVYTETEMLIRGVTIARNKESATASLNVVLPGAFSGEPPPGVPWAG